MACGGPEPAVRGPGQVPEGAARGPAQRHHLGRHPGEGGEAAQEERGDAQVRRGRREDESRGREGG